MQCDYYSISVDIDMMVNSLYKGKAKPVHNLKKEMFVCNSVWKDDQQNRKIHTSSVLSTQKATIYITHLVFMQHSDICTNKDFYERNYVTSPVRAA